MTAWTTRWPSGCECFVDPNPNHPKNTSRCNKSVPYSHLDCFETTVVVPVWWRILCVSGTEVDWMTHWHGRGDTPRHWIQRSPGHLQRSGAQWCLFAGSPTPMLPCRWPRQHRWMRAWDTIRALFCSKLFPVFLSPSKGKPNPAEWWMKTSVQDCQLIGWFFPFFFGTVFRTTSLSYLPLLWGVKHKEHAMIYPNWQAVLWRVSQNNIKSSSR